MIAYAIHRETKEHRRADTIFEQTQYGAEWRIVEADADGWIVWHGGECPLSSGSRCDIRSSVQAAQVHDLSAMSLDWQLVRFYRPILNDEPADPGAETGVPEWDGEGLPPVGCEVLASWLQREASRDNPEPILIKGVFGDQVWFSRLSGEEIVCLISNLTIRTAAQRSVDAMAKAIFDSHPAIGSVRSHDAAYLLYSELRDGKITGVRLDD